MSFYSIPILIGAIFSIIVGCLIFLANRRSQNNVSFSLFCFSLFVWLFGYVVAYSIKDEKIALLFCRIACTGAMFTAPTFYHFAVSFLQKKNEIKFVIIAYFAMLLLVPFSMTSNLFLSGTYKYFWGYYSKAGYLHPLYLILFFGIFLRGFYILLLANRKVYFNPVMRMQIRYIFIAYAIALLGAIDYIPKYGIEIFPFGFLFEILFVIIVAYAIITRRILDINIVLIRTVIFISVYLVFLGMPIGLGVFFRQYLSEKLGFNWWLIPAILLAIMTALGSFAFMFLRGRVESRLFKEKYVSHKNLMAVTQTIILIRDFNKLLNIIVRILTKTLNIEYAGMYLYNRSYNKFVFNIAHGTRRDFINIDIGNSLIKYLQSVRKPIVLEELRRDYSERRDIFIKEMVDTMNRLNAYILVPTFVADELIGFIVLGNKRSGEIYTTEDLNVLSNLANQSALAIENAQFLKEREEMQIKLRKASTLAAMGELLGIVDHEFRNKLGLIYGPVQGMAQGMYRNKPEEEAKAANTISENMLIMQAMLKSLQEYRTKSQSNITTLHSMQDMIQRAIDHSKDKMAEWKISTHSVFIPNIMIKGAQTLPDIFKHLIINAVYSMEDGGSITIRAREIRQENVIEITIDDEGKDISQQIKEKELAGGGYFVDRGKLGGLNLVLAQKIIADHKGSLEVQSNNLRGTKFVVRLLIDSSEE